MDVTGINTGTTTGSGLTSETSNCDGTGNYKSQTVRPAEDKEVFLNPANSGSANTGASGTSPPGVDSLFTLADSRVSHSGTHGPIAGGSVLGTAVGSEESAVGSEVGSEESTKGSQKVTFSADLPPANQTKLHALLASENVEKQSVIEELQKLVQQFDELHVSFSLMDKLSILKINIRQYIESDMILVGKRFLTDDVQLRRIIADGIQKVVRDIAIWAGINTNNLKVLTYIIEQGFPIKQDILWIDPNPESIVYLPFETMMKLVDNCSPRCPDLLFVKAIFADADPRFDDLTQTILTFRPISDVLFLEAIAQSIPTVSNKRLTVFFDYLHSEFNTWDMIEDLVKQRYGDHRISVRGKICKYKKSITMLFVLEAIAQQSPDKARTLIRSFCPGEQQLMAMTALLGGLHQTTELLSEMGITVAGHAFREASVNLKNSPFLMAKEAGLTNERLFTNTVNRVAPFLWTLPNENGLQWYLDCRLPDKKSQSFIHLVMKQASIYQNGSHEPKRSHEPEKWSGPNHAEQLVPGDVSLWAANIFTVLDDTVSANIAGLLQKDARYSEAWNILISKAKCCNGLTSPGDFMKFMDWLLIEGLSLVRMEPEHREEEANYNTRQKSYRPDLWPDPQSNVSTTSSASNDRLVAYTKLVTTLHFDIIESFLRLAPTGHRIHVLNNWLTDPDCAEQRETLFRQPVYPLNTMGSPYVWQLLLSLDKDYQPPENQFDNDWKKPDNAPIDSPPFPSAKRLKPGEKSRDIESKAGSCLHLKSTKLKSTNDVPYHLYLCDLDPVTNADQIFAGLYNYAHDCGVLFSCGLYAPAVITAEHNSVTNRKHHVLSSYVDAACEEQILQWKKASEHSNVGPAGIRNFDATKSMIELGEDYFFSRKCQTFLDFEQSEDRAKVAFSELANNAQELVLQYARCFQQQFNPVDRESILNHEGKIKVILATLFHMAFPQFSQECVDQAMDEDGLLSQAVREVIYWCGHDAGFIHDIKQNIIPKYIYPGCSESTNIADFSILEHDELIPGVGFVTWDNQPDLGVSFGVNPLVALNAVIVKLLARGALASV